MARSRGENRRNQQGVDKFGDLRTASEASASAAGSFASRSSMARQHQQEARTAARMLGEIVVFLQTQARGVRATNIFSTLPDIVSLPPTTRQLLIDWSNSGKRKSEILSARDTARTAFETLRDAADPEQHRERTRGPGFFDTHGHYGRLHGHATFSYDEGALAALTTLMPALVAAVPADHPQAWARELHADLGDWADQVQQIEQAVENYGALAEEGEDLQSERSDLEAFLETLDQILGKARGAWRSPLVENQAPRNLPQLYELWVLCTLLDAAQRAGHVITLVDAAGLSPGEPWALKYAAASRHVAMLDDVHVFFQLKDDDKHAMPDRRVVGRLRSKPPHP